MSASSFDNPVPDPLPVTDESSPISEADRLRALRGYRVLDSGPEAKYDRVTELAARLFEVPMSLISLIDEDRQWFKSHFGLDVEQTSRQDSFCAQFLGQSQPLVVPDATLDVRFADNPMVVGAPFVRFYASAPLIDSAGNSLGALCVIDTKAREFDAKSQATLTDLAAIVIEELESRLVAEKLLQEASAHRDVQAALLDSQNRFKRAFQMSANGMTLVSPQGSFLQVNQPLCEMLKFSEGELLGKTFQDITFPDDLDVDLGLVRQILAGEIENYNLDKRYICGDGSILWASISVALVRDKTEEPSYFVVQVQDISERRRTEFSLRQSEARKAAILESALDCIITIDTESNIYEWNPAAEKTFGFSREEALQSKLHQLIVPEGLREAHIAGLAHWTNTGKGPILGQRIELPAVCADGNSIMVELAVVPIPDSSPPLFTGYLRDISLRKQTLDALSESEARFHSIAANMPGMVYKLVLSPDGTFSFPYVSDGCRELYGLEPEEIQRDAQAIMNYVHPDDADDFYISISQSAQTMEPWEWEGRIQLPGEVVRWVRGNSRPRREEDGQITWDGIILDLTQRKMQEEQLQSAMIEAESAREEAERANLAKSEFLSRMSHELRTPLNAILGFGQLLEMSDLDEGDAQSTTQIIKAGRHLLGLINEVLDIARIESGKLAISTETVEAGEVALEVLDLVRPLAHGHEIEIDDTEPRKCELHIVADRQRLKQILLNLLSNAVKYNQQGGKIKFSISAEGDRVRMSVSDTGPGIAPQDIEKLWMPFERLGAEKGNIEGTGVGLTVSHRLAQAMGSSLEVTSELGQGSTFWLDLPRAPDPHVEPEIPAPLVIPTITSTRFVILYIEDNPSNLQLIQRVLRARPEIRLLSAMQGELGYELAYFHRPDLILLDLHLPDTSGLDVFRRLKENEETSHIPIVMLSADATPGQARRALDAGAKAYLTKPIEVGEFFECIDGIMNQSSDDNGKKMETRAPDDFAGESTGPL